MKNAIIGATLLIVICLMTLIHLSISSENIRQNELDQSLSSAIRTTMEVAKIKGTYEITNEEEFLNEFNKNLLSRIHTDSDIEVQVMGCNLEEGFLDIKVISKFKYPTGASGQVESRKSIIFDEKQQSKEIEKNYTIIEHLGNYYRFDNKELISNTSNGFSDSNTVLLNCNFVQGKEYRIEIDMYDSNNYYYGGSLSGDIVLSGNIENGVWTTDGTKSIYTFTASKTSTEATLFSGGFYVQTNNVKSNVPFGSMRIFQI